MQHELLEHQEAEDEAARVEGNAVFALTGPRPLAAILEDLSKRLPKRLIKQRKQGGATLNYIEWHTAVRLLDLYAPGWSGRVVNVWTSDPAAAGGGEVYVAYGLTIPTSDFGNVTREDTGSESLEGVQYGESLANAQRQALKRAAALFGVALYLYDK